MKSPLALPFAADHATLEAILAGASHPSLATRRSAAFARLEGLGRALTLPYRRPLWTAGESIMQTAPIAAATEIGVTNDGRPSDELATLALANAGGLVHFGGLAIRNSRGQQLPAGVTVMTLADALTQRPDEIEAFLARRVDQAKTRDALLTAAFMNCGAYLHVEPGVRIERPLQLLWIYAVGQAHTVFPFIAISLGAGAQATVFERHLGGGDAFVCGMTDAQLGAGANLQYVVLQQLNDGSQIRMTRSGVVEKRATLAWHIADLGAAKVRNTTLLSLQGVSATGNYAALAFRNGKQRFDTTLRIDIRAEGAHSRSVTNVALTNAAVARHHERLSIRGRAPRADAVSYSDGLLLSRKAAIEFIPERHAAHDRASLYQRSRIGSIDADTMFYLASRGIDHLAAMKIVALGFFEPAILAFPSEIIRDEVRTALDEHIEEAIT